MLLTNQRLDKLGASYVEFLSRGMLNGPVTTSSHPPIISPLPPENLDDDAEDNAASSLVMWVPPMVTLAKTHARGYSRCIYGLAKELSIPDLPLLLQHFLFGQLRPQAIESLLDLPPSTLPQISGGKTCVFFSALAQFYAPSDQSGIGGMHRERIRATPSWQGGAPRNDCVFIYRADSEITPWPGFRALHAAHVVLFFSFKRHLTIYPCALVQWF